MIDFDKYLLFVDGVTSDSSKNFVDLAGLCTPFPQGCYTKLV